jgi:uncharacterized protein YjiK
MSSFANRINRTGKFNQDTIARCLHHTAAMRPDLRVENVTSARLERGKRTFLVISHETTVLGDVGRKNGC